MKKVLVTIAVVFVALVLANSCGTGFSKSTYISALERFVNKVEQNCGEYSSEDWQQVM